MRARTTSLQILQWLLLNSSTQRMANPPVSSHCPPVIKFSYALNLHPFLAVQSHALYSIIKPYFGQKVKVFLTFTSYYRPK
jgi:hypothetical protein